MKKQIVTSMSLISAFLLSANNVLAACFVNGKEVPCSEFPWWILIVVFVVAILVLVFWIRMIIDAIKNKRTGWAVIIFLFQFLGAVVYYFAVKKGSTQQQISQ